MNLLVDIGNTRIKWAFWTPSGLLNPLAVAHKGADLNVLFSEIWGSASPFPQVVYVSNVAGPTAAETLKKWVKAHWKIPARFFVSEKERAGIKNGYQKPETLGVDRWLTMLGTQAHYPPPFCVMDCGSAITTDAVSGTGEHLGGLIFPGLTRLQTALLEECPHLPPFEKGGLGGIFNKEPLFAENTQDGIVQGTFFMITATFKHILEKLNQRFGTPFSPIVTGGDAAYLLPYLPKEFQHRPNLVLEGIVAFISRG